MKIRHNTLIALIALSIITIAAGCSSTRNAGDERISTAISADGSPITYGVLGQGEITLVFIHCWTCNHAFWRPQLAHFSNRYRVVWLDLAGHGLSGSHRQRYTMTAFGEDVAAVVNQTNGKRIVLVGHSMGGPVAIEAARILGDRVIGIVGVDTFHTPFEYPKTEAEIRRFAAPFENDFKGTSESLVRSMFTPGADPETVASIVNQMSVASPDMGISAMYEMFRWRIQNIPSVLDRYSDRLRNINGAPTGQEKPLHESMTLIPGVGHFVAQVKPHAFNSALHRIMAEYPAR